jgi:hypothetical protein
LPAPHLFGGGKIGRRAIAAKRSAPTIAHQRYAPYRRIGEIFAQSRSQFRRNRV